MGPISRPTLLILAFFPLAAHGQVALQPYAIDWSKAAESAIDLSGYLKAPAGEMASSGSRDPTW